MSASQDLWAIPLAKRLVDRFRSQKIAYIRVETGVYDEQTGTLPVTETRIEAAGAVVKSAKNERDGVQQDHEVEAWIDHTTVPWVVTTQDRIEYLGKSWKIVAIDPTYGSGGSGAVAASALLTLSGDTITTLSGDQLVLSSAEGAAPFNMYASKIIARAE